MFKATSCTWARFLSILSIISSVTLKGLRESSDCWFTEDWPVTPRLTAPATGFFLTGGFVYVYLSTITPSSVSTDPRLELLDFFSGPPFPLSARIALPFHSVISSLSVFYSSLALLALSFACCLRSLITSSKFLLMSVQSTSFLPASEVSLTISYL
jgi:hypothetical protein